MLSVVESKDLLEVRSVMPRGRRMVFGLIALVPLLAPWALMIRPGWTGHLNLFFFVSAAISLGALFVSAFLVFAAVAGLNSSLRLDRRAGSFTYTIQAPVVRPRTVRGHSATSPASAPRSTTGARASRAGRSSW